MVGEDPGFSACDLFDAIERGIFPALRVCVQIMPEADALDYHQHPFELARVRPHVDYPLHEYGELVINRDPDNYFAEVEQAAFEPSNVVFGVG